MGGSTRLLACSCRTRNGIDSHVLLQQIQVSGRQQGHLNTGSKTAGVSHMLGLGNLLAVNLRQAIHIVVIAFDAEVLGEVDNLHVLWNRMFLEERFALAVTEAEEQNIDLVKGHLVGEAQFRLTDESFMDIAYQISRIALGIGKDYLCLRMVEQQTDEFTTRIACRTKYSNFNHKFV